jgi:hypothetical protein
MILRDAGWWLFYVNIIMKVTMKKCSSNVHLIKDEAKLHDVSWTLKELSDTNAFFRVI